MLIPRTNLEFIISPKEKQKNRFKQQLRVEWRRNEIFSAAREIAYRRSLPRRARLVCSSSLSSSSWSHFSLLGRRRHVCLRHEMWEKKSACMNQHKTIKGFKRKLEILSSSSFARHNPLSPRSLQINASLSASQTQLFAVYLFFARHIPASSAVLPT